MPENATIATGLTKSTWSVSSLYKFNLGSRVTDRMNLSAPQDCHFHGFLEKVSFTVVEIYRKIDKLICGFLFSQTINLLLNTDKN